MENQNVITFDNLRQADREIAGQTQSVKAIWPVAEHFSQPNAKGELYQPKSLEDITDRAKKSATRFCEMFQQKSE
jgi:hypothetical protein